MQIFLFILFSDGSFGRFERIDNDMTFLIMMNTVQIQSVMCEVVTMQMNYCTHYLLQVDFSHAR